MKGLVGGRGACVFENSLTSPNLVLQKGFPLDASLDDIMAWLDNKGKVESIQMRRTFQKTFKVTYFTQHSASYELFHETIPHLT